MLGRHFRFHGHGSLRYIYRHGRAGRSRLLSIRYADNPHRTHTRVAIIVAKKTVKAAPKRNRIRRRLFEALRLNWPALVPHHDIIITIHSSEFLTMPFDQLQRELGQLLASSQLLVHQQIDKNAEHRDESEAHRAMLRGDT